MVRVAVTAFIDRMAAIRARRDVGVDRSVAVGHSPQLVDALFPAVTE